MTSRRFSSCRTGATLAIAAALACGASARAADADGRHVEHVARAKAAPSPAPTGAAATTASTALVHHPVSTGNARAQAAFDEGLTLVYAFNRDEARKRFERAAALDPKLAIAWWGVALAVGPNLNFGIDGARIAAANAAIARARGEDAVASPEERALIDAVALRYPSSESAPKEPGYRAYRDAMHALHLAYPMDDDVATLYAESVMDVDRWAWTNGVPNAAGREIRSTLEAVLARDPGHVGANHYFVHLTDEPGVANLGVPSAERLSALAVEPAASHLVHMAGHTYLDVGRYGDLERDNEIAVDDDRAYAASIGKKPIDLDYYRHDLDFDIGGATMLEDRLEEERAAAFAREFEGAEPALVAAREGRFASVLALPLPSATAALDDVASVRYARAIAAVGLADLDGAQRELAAFDASIAAVPLGRRGRRARVFPLVRDLVVARIAHARGDDDAAVAGLRAVIASTADDPPEVLPAWFFPAGEWLGWIEFERGNVRAAEDAFRSDLVRTPHNARASFGLMETLGREGRTADAGPLAADVVAHWRGPLADVRAGVP